MTTHEVSESKIVKCLPEYSAELYKSIETKINKLKKLLENNDDTDIFDSLNEQINKLKKQKDNDFLFVDDRIILTDEAFKRLGLIKPNDLKKVEEKKVEEKKEDNKESHIDKCVREFITNNKNIKIEDKTICKLFIKIWPNDYIYDGDNQAWYSINKYGIYRPENAQLLTASYRLSEDLCNSISSVMNKMILDSAGFEKQALCKILSKLVGFLSRNGTTKSIIEFLRKYYQKYNISSKFNRVNNYLFPFNNGVFDLKTVTFRNAKPEELITKTCGYDYVEDINDSIKDKDNEILKIKRKIQDIISKILSNKEKRRYVMKIMGLRLATKNFLEEFYFFLGEGSNGKTLLLDLLVHTLGDFCGFFDPALFGKNKSHHANAPSPELAKAVDYKAAITSELDSGTKLMAAIIKRMTGGDYITCRNLNQSPFKYKPGFVLFFLSNKEPIIDGADGGLARRLRYIWFDSKFVDNPDPKDPNQYKIDRTLKEKFEDDKYKIAFFHILKDYYYLFMAENYDEENNIIELTPPDSVIAASAKFMNENDPLKQFVSSCLEITNNLGDFIYSAELYAMYQANNMGSNRGITTMEFKNQLKTRFNIDSKKTNKGLRFLGIKLLQKDDAIAIPDNFEFKD